MQVHPTPRRGTPRTESPIEKAARLLRQARVTAKPSATVYEVIGDSANYMVVADGDGVYCPCKATVPLCAHVIAVTALRAKGASHPPADFSVRLGVR